MTARAQPASVLELDVMQRRMAFCKHKVVKSVELMYDVTRTGDDPTSPEQHNRANMMMMMMHLL